MGAKQQELAIMFADVAGSTRLYEVLGDTTAQQVIGDLLGCMSGIIQHHAGTVIKTIGDEVMCRFATASAAVNAAVAIQMEIDARPGDARCRIGIHFGPTILQQDGDVFGDTVNIAARLAGMAKARQIIISGETARTCTPELQDNTRLIDRAPVRGKALPIEIHEVLWEPGEDITLISGRDHVGQENEATRALRLLYASNSIDIAAHTQGITIGRSTDCDLVVPAPAASRWHARIEYRRGKYILVDDSTNGTYVQQQNDRMIFLHHEEIPLWGKGVIGLGEKISELITHPIHYVET